MVNGIASSSQLTGLVNTGDKITVFLKPYGPIFLFFNTLFISSIDFFAFDSERIEVKRILVQMERKVGIYSQNQSEEYNLDSCCFGW